MSTLQELICERCAPEDWEQIGPVVAALERLAKAAIAKEGCNSLPYAQWTTAMHAAGDEYDAALEAVRKVMP